MDKNKEPVWGTNCMSCGFDKCYFEGESVPESCPQCGEHKNYDMLELEQLRN